jgi:hypothetical protein
MKTRVSNNVIVSKYNKEYKTFEEVTRVIVRSSKLTVNGAQRILNRMAKAHGNIFDGIVTRVDSSIVLI